MKTSIRKKFTMDPKREDSSRSQDQINQPINRQVSDFTLLFFIFNLSRVFLSLADGRFKNTAAPINSLHSFIHSFAFIRRTFIRSFDDLSFLYSSTLYASCDLFQLS